MKIRDCSVYRLIQAKVDSANGSRRLTKADREEVNTALEDYCYLEACENPEECDRLNGVLADFLPPESGHIEHANAKSKNQTPSKGDWIPQLYSRPLFQRVRERMYC